MWKRSFFFSTPFCRSSHSFSFSCHVSWGELLCVGNVNAALPSPVLLNESRHQLPLRPCSSWLSGCLLVPTNPAVRPRASTGEALRLAPGSRSNGLKYSVSQTRRTDNGARWKTHLQLVPCSFVLQPRLPSPQLETYVFVYIGCASVLIFCGFLILADHKVGFHFMHRTTFMDSIFFNFFLMKY